MKFSAILLSLGTILFFMNCGQNADFNSDERFKSLVDGETVEVVSNEEMGAINDQGDQGITGGDGTNGGMGDGDGSMDGDGGLGGGDGSMDGDGGASGGMDNPGGDGTYTGGDGSEDGSNDGMGDEDTYAGPGNSGSRGGHGKDKKCKERLLEQDERGEHDEMVTSPEEMETDSDMFEASRCGSKDHKVLVCHFPNADYSKRKTLCIGRPALEAHIAHLGNKRGTGHVDYAGPCKDMDGNIADGDHSSRGGEDDDDEVDSANLDFSGRR